MRATWLAWLLLLAACGTRSGADAAGPAPPVPAARESERGRMVDEQIAARGVRDPRVLAAMRRVPRHEFVPLPLRPFAYTDRPLAIGNGQTISQPYIVAVMTELAALDARSHVLEVGTGSGYQAAVLAEVAREVYTIEILEPLARRAERTLRRLGYAGVYVRHGDGRRGWPEAAPFDAIVVSAAPVGVPPALLAQLAPGGRLVIPVGDEDQELQVHRRTPDGIVVEHVFPVRFVPLTGGDAAARQPALASGAKRRYVARPVDGNHVGLGLLCVTLAGVANVLGGAVVVLRHWDDRFLRYAVALGAGFMLAAVVLKMMPQAERLTTAAPWLVLAGYLLIHLFEHTVAPHFHFGEEVHPEQLSGRAGASALIGLMVHSLFDGISIGSGFIIDRALGLLLFAAILLHKAPEGFAIASVVLAARGTRRQALFAAAAVGVASLVGGLSIFGARELVGPALALSAGVTLYVAASDLVPEVNKEESTVIALTVFAGVVLYYLTERLLEAAGA